MSPPSLTGADPAAYVRHSLHAPSRTYAETNCYADVVIELLHAAGLEPLAMFGHLVAIDFEGDQWTFFKPPAEDLERLFGVDIHEMNPYRPVELQIAEQIERGRTLIVELDSWYLPDLVDRGYRSEHVKTSCGFDLIDPAAERLHYFHGPGCFALQGADYRGALRLDATAPELLPPYVELVRFDAGPRLEGEALRVAARATLARHLARRPADDPVARFAAALEAGLPALLGGGLDGYHAYAFATVRILGSAFEVLASFTRWLFPAASGADGTAAAAHCDAVVAATKALSFRLARRRTFDPAPLLDALAAGYAGALAELTELTR
ncbi:MAG TPA: DUF1839 family protein [Solirubrobacteraceae bacterium]|nr:DUF1839 family protein [Solirubrobacteraceae bacterium]